MCFIQNEVPAVDSTLPETWQYCWWKKSCTGWHGPAPVFDGVSEKFHPVQDFFHEWHRSPSCWQKANEFVVRNCWKPAVFLIRMSSDSKFNSGNRKIIVFWKGSPFSRVPFSGSLNSVKSFAGNNPRASEKPVDILVTVPRACGPEDLDPSNYEHFHKAQTPPRDDLVRGDGWSTFDGFWGVVGLSKLLGSFGGHIYYSFVWRERVCQNLQYRLLQCLGKTQGMDYVIFVGVH